MAEPTTQVPEDEENDASAAEDAADARRLAFETALERKKAAGQARAAHLDGATRVGSATASHKSSRTFRRKSG